MQEFNKQNINYLKYQELGNTGLAILIGSGSTLIFIQILENIFKYLNLKKKINKDFKPKCFKDIENKKTVTFLNQKKLYIKCPYNDIITFFKCRLENLNPNNDYTILKNNLKSLLIINHEFLINEKETIKSLACYNHLGNWILVDKKFVHKVLFHELFHVASSIKIKNDNNTLLFSGFRQTKNDETIGIGLNEGYTEILVKRYFKENNDLITYPIETSIAKSLEIIVESEKMEQLYFTADLKGLILELCKYIDKEEIMDFLTKLDFLYKYSNLKNTNSLIQKKLKSSLLITNKFLIKCYYKKLEIMHINNLIDDIKIKENMYNFLNTLTFSFEVYNKNKKYIIQIDNKKLIKVKNNTQ